jgi:hypothetical protein
LDLPDGTNGRASSDKEGEEEQRGAQGEEAGGAGWVVAAGTGAAAGEERGEGTPRGAISLCFISSYHQICVSSTISRLTISFLLSSGNSVILFVFALFFLVQAISAFQIALQHNPQNTEISRKIKRLTQLAREKKRALDVENMRSNIDIGKNLESLKTELVSLLLWLVDVMAFSEKGRKFMTRKSRNAHFFFPF